MITEAATVAFDQLELDCGVTLAPVDCAYETYGTLNAAKSNAILVTHAFSGDAHAAGEGGWWSNMIGPGKGFDTDHYFVICANVLGGCRGTTGPGSINPATGCPWGMAFPAVTIADMVRLQKKLIEHLGIQRLLAVAGGSMGGMQALEWAVAYPDHVLAALPIATTTRHSAQQIAFNEVGRQAIMADPDWNSGNYYDRRPPARGLAVARMVGHITYMSDESMREKFGRRLRSSDEFEVESYLKYRGYKFVDRFDANSYLYITRAMDSYDLTQRGSLQTLFENIATRFLVISFTSDWLYPSYQSLEIVSALRSRNCDVAYVNLAAVYGHDSFLVEVQEQTQIVRGFLASTFREGAVGGSRNLRAQRLRYHRRTDRAWHARARSGLWRRTPAGLVERKQAGQRTRSGDGGRERAESHRARGFRVSGRSRNRSRRLSRRRVRLCDSQPDAARDAQSAESSPEYVTHRPPWHRGVPQLRPLECALGPSVDGPGSKDRTVPARLVRFAQHSLPHGVRFRVARTQAAVAH